MIPLNEMCSKWMHGGSWAKITCSRRGKLVHEGKRYCKQHYPPTVKATREARRTKHLESYAKETKRRYEAGMARDRKAIVEFLEWINSACWDLIQMRATGRDKMLDAYFAKKEEDESWPDTES